MNEAVPDRPGGRPNEPRRLILWLTAGDFTIDANNGMHADTADADRNLM